MNHATRHIHLRTRLPLILAGFLILAQVVNPDRVFMMMLAALGLVVVLSWVWARSLHRHLQARRWSQGRWWVVGDTLVEHFQVENLGFWPLLWAEVRDFSDLPGYAIQRVIAVEGHGAFAWETQARCTQRGVFTLGPWELHARDPLGLFQITLRLPAYRTILIYPRMVRLPEFPLPYGRTGGRALRPAWVVQADLVAGARPWQPGDSLHLVHWKLTAHTGQLMVKQFEQEPAGDLWLMLNLDAGVQAGQGQESTVEYGVTLAASLAARHLNENRAVGLIALGSSPVILPPRVGRDHLWALLHALSHVQPSAQWPLDQALKYVQPELGRDKTLLLITPTMAAEAWLPQLWQLRRQDIAAAVILLDAASFRGQEDAQVQRLQALLVDHHIPVSIIRQGHGFQPLGMFRRRRKVLKTLPGFGRVVEMEVEEWV